MEEKMAAGIIGRARKYGENLFNSTGDDRGCHYVGQWI